MNNTISQYNIFNIRWVLLNIGLQVNILRRLDNILLIDTEYTLS